MKIVFLLHGFMYYTSQLANSLVGLGHDVTIVAPITKSGFVGTGRGDVKADYREILDPKIKLEWFDFPDNTSLPTLLTNVKFALGLAKLIKKLSPEILHMHDVPDYRLYTVLMLNRSLPVVLTIHDAEPHPGERRTITDYIRQKIRTMADQAIVHGEDIRKRLLKASKIREDRVNMIAHGAYTLYRHWMSSGQNVERPYVLFFGRVLLYKGLDYLIQAAPEICKRVPGAKIVIAGAGPDWERCRKLIKNPDHFILHEKLVYDPDVTKLFQESAVVALPYIEASQSGVLNIAYAMEKPVVITNVGSLPEVVEDNITGLIVPPADHAALAEAIIKLLTNDQLRKDMGAKAYEKATVGDLSWDRIAVQTVDVYQKALNHRN